MLQPWIAGRKNAIRERGGIDIVGRRPRLLLIIGMAVWHVSSEGVARAMVCAWCHRAGLQMKLLQLWVGLGVFPGPYKGFSQRAQLSGRLKIHKAPVQPVIVLVQHLFAVGEHKRHVRDRKSTRLNSSHVAISYAVFCLKKKR